MHVFIDTEFTDLQDPQLISLGLVTDDDRAHYVEISDFDRDACSSYVKQVILPFLGLRRDGMMTLRLAAEELRQILNGLGPAVTVVYDDSTDLELFQKALDLVGGAHCVIHPRCIDADELEMPEFHEASMSAYRTGRVHNALVEARALRAGFHALYPVRASEVSQS